MKNFLLQSVVFFFFPLFVCASVEITEVMYDVEGSDTGHEWIEIHNSGSNEIDMSDWRLREADANHKLVAQNSAILSAGSYAVIADNADMFMKDHVGFSGMLFDSSFSLKSSGEEIGIRNGELVDVDTVFYDTEVGAAGDGNSLQKVDGVWVARVPTPGNKNKESATGSASTQTNQENSTQQNNDSGSVSYVPTEPQIFAFAGPNREVSVGASVVFNGKALGLEKEPLAGARYVWNFGDGTVTEGKNVSHYFKYPGKFSVILSVSSSEYSAIDQVRVVAERADVTISDFQAGESGFVEIYNRGEKELDISFWQLRSGVQLFVIPEHTHIFANTKTRFSVEATGLALVENSTIDFYYPNGSKVENLGKGELVENTQEKSPVQDEFVAGSPPSSTKQTKQTKGGSVKEAKVKTPKKVVIATAPTPEILSLDPNKQAGTEETEFVEEEKRAISSVDINPDALVASLKPVQEKGVGMQWFFVLLGMSMLLSWGVFFVRMKEKENYQISAEAESIDILD